MTLPPVHERKAALEKSIEKSIPHEIEVVELLGHRLVAMMGLTSKMSDSGLLHINPGASKFTKGIGFIVAMSDQCGQGSSSLSPYEPWPLPDEATNVGLPGPDRWKGIQDYAWLYRSVVMGAHTGNTLHVYDTDQDYASAFQIFNANQVWLFTNVEAWGAPIEELIYTGDMDKPTALKG